MPNYETKPFQVPHRHRVGIFPQSEGRYAQANVLSVVAGEFSPEVQSIWRNERIAEYLAASNLRRHVWHAWLTSDFGSDYSADCAHERLTSERSRLLLAEAYPEPRNGLLSALARLDYRARTKAFYRDLATAISNGGSIAKFVWHSDDLTAEQLAFLARLRPEYATPGVLAMATYPFMHRGEAGLICWLADRLAAVVGNDEVRQLLAQSRPLDAIRKRIGKSAFPPAPWVGTPNLIPVCSQLHLRDLADRLHNCLTDETILWEAISGVLQGNRYFYEWTGEEVALVLVRPIGNLGWVVAEADGVGSNGLADTTVLEIEANLGQSPNICPTLQPRGRSQLLDELALA